jgi:type I restriction enzyme M protein
MNEKLIAQMLEQLRVLPLSRADAMQLALLFLAWAKLSTGRRIPDDLCVAPRFLANPSHVVRTWNAIGAINPEFFRPFAETRRMTLDTALLRPALDFAIRLTESGAQQNPERTPVPLTDHIYRQLEDGIPPEVASFLVELARVQPGETVYTPWDNYGQLAERAANKGAQVFLESTSSACIPEIISLFSDQPFNVRHSDPVRSPSAIDQGKLRTFDVAIAFPPFGMRYEADTSRLDLLNRFPEHTASGAVLSIRHLLAQAKGRIVVVVPNQVLFSEGVEGELRGDLLEHRRIESVIAMPSGLLQSSTAAFAILVLTPEREQQSIRFLNAETTTYREPISKARSRLTNIPSLIALLDPAQQSADAATVGVEDIQGESTGHLQVQRFVRPKDSQRFDVIEAEWTERVEAIVEFVRPMPVASKASTSTIEAWEIAAANLPAYGYITQPGRAVQIDARMAEKNREQFLQPLDIVLIVKGSVGKIGIVPPDLPESGPRRWIAGQSAIVLRGKPKKGQVSGMEGIPSGGAVLLESPYLDPRALLMELRSAYGQDLLSRIVVNASIPLIRLAELEEMAIPVRNEHLQKLFIDALEEEARLQSQIISLQEAQSNIASSLRTLQQER